MSQAVEKIIAQIDALTPDERGELAYAFLCHFDLNETTTLAWEAEVQRRLIETRTSKQAGIPAKELFAALRERSKS